ncbi:MAG: Peptidoglycan-binding domain 1 protein [Ilumatobacteraceae bacterium]|nr:Peptidoglycan-binding domain 1 protein [Ilumatobacteraceae bacterium]
MRLHNKSLVGHSQCASILDEVNGNLSPQRYGRRRVIGVVVAVLAVVGAGVAVVVTRGRLDAGRERAATTTLPLSTVAVTRMDLSDTTSFDGSLAYTSPITLKGTGTGTITKLAEVGTVAQRGFPLYSVNDKPVPVFFGDTPLFRPVGRVGMSGSDVAMVASNLAALGLIQPSSTSDHGKVVWTTAMRAALGNFQAWVGLPVTRTLAVGDVIVLGAPLRVDTVVARTGDAVSTDLLTLTSQHKSITMLIDPAAARGITVGVAAAVTLGDGTIIPATFTSLSSATVPPPSDRTTGPSDADQKVTVTVEPDDDSTVTDVVDSPVRVSVTTRTRSNVLTVPVDALLGLREGGYALQTTDGTLVAVTLGMIAGDRVEISGPDVRDGLSVVTAA